MYSITNLAERYGVTEHTVLAWIKSGEMKAINVGRSPKAKKPRWRVSKEALDAFEELRSPIVAQPKTRRRSKKPNDVIPFIK